jgi:hypothetical protein
MADLGKIQYRVVPVTRYHVTRYWEGVDGNTGTSEGKGEYDSPELAHEVAYALCRDEHTRLGLPPGDERIIYPRQDAATAFGASAAGISRGGSVGVRAA